MNAYVSKEELALLPANRINFPEHYADAQPQRRGVVSTILGRIAAMVERHRVLSELNSLSDRELVDIGLSRADLGRVFEPGFAGRTY